MCWRAGSLLFLRKSQEQSMCHFLACVTQLKRPRQPPSPAQGGEEPPRDAVPLRTRGPAPEPLTAVPEGGQELLPSPCALNASWKIYPGSEKQGFFLLLCSFQPLLRQRKKTGLETEDAIRSLCNADAQGSALIHVRVRTFFSSLPSGCITVVV